MTSSLFWDFTQRKLLVTDVSVQPIGPIFKGQDILTPEDETYVAPKRRYLRIYAA
jgi:hypothetical protein